MWGMWTGLAPEYLFPRDEVRPHCFTAVSADRSGPLRACLGLQEGMSFPGQPDEVLRIDRQIVIARFISLHPRPPTVPTVPRPIAERQ
jgi:hypothetical protein